MTYTMSFTDAERQRTRLLCAQSITARTEAMRIRAAARRITQAWERSAALVWQFGNQQEEK